MKRQYSVVVGITNPSPQEVLSRVPLAEAEAKAHELIANGWQDVAIVPVPQPGWPG